MPYALIFLALACFLELSLASAAMIPASLDALLPAQIQAEINYEIQAAVKAYSKTALPKPVTELIASALDLDVLLNTSTIDLPTLQHAVDAKLEHVEDEVYKGLSSQTKFLGIPYDDRRFKELKSCISTVVKHQGTKSGKRCLIMNDSASMGDLKLLFEQVVKQHQFQMPIDAYSKLIKSLNAYLDHSNLIAPAQDLIRDTEASMLSVISSTAGSFTDAIYYAEACFFEALAQPVFSMAFVHDCNVQNDHASTLNSIQDIFRETVNQYSGILPVKIVEDIQAIGNNYLTTKMSGSAPKETRDDINQAILSVVASYGGNTATLVFQLLKCLNEVMIPSAGNSTTQTACLNSPTGPAATVFTRINGYLEQFYGVLPPKLVLDLEDEVLPFIMNQTERAQAKAKLDALFTASGAGPEFVSCFEVYEACILKALSDLDAAFECKKSSKCKKIPFKSALFSPTSPYEKVAMELGYVKSGKDAVWRPLAEAGAFIEASKRARYNARLHRIEKRDDVSQGLMRHRRKHKDNLIH